MDTNEPFSGTDENDPVVKRTVEAHIKNHIDPYPIALELAATALKAHQEADNRGGSEPEIVQAILHHIKTLLLHRDKASASFFDTKASASFFDTKETNQ